MSMQQLPLGFCERAIFALRSLYNRHGYTQYKMSKFEEYDLYSRNKEFLLSDGVITFTDTGGKLMALKPDVTLSIVKNTADTPNITERLYYNENVYRISDSTRHYKEIMQTGIECIGDLNEYNQSEVLYLAARSLQTISSECALNISHLGIVSALLDGEALGAMRAPLLKCIGEKNPHGIKEICAECGIDGEKEELLIALTESYGDVDGVLSALRARTDNEALLSALCEFENIVKLLGEVSGVRICADFSLIGDMSYYNGIIFRGYVKGIPTSVLTGGQYDRLMEKMGKSSRAIGFAVYLDLLARLEAPAEFDVDVLLLADRDTEPSIIAKRAECLTREGKSVAVQYEIPSKLRYRAIERLTKENK